MRRDIMKKRFIQISRIFIILFGCELAVLLGFIFFTKEDEIAIPSILGVAFLIGIIGMLVCVAIAFVLDAIESIKRDNFSYIAGYLGAVAVLTIAVTAVDYFWGEQQGAILETAIKALVVVGGSRAVEYVFRKEK